MRGFEIMHPATIEEAIRLLSVDDPGVRPFSGGTALMQMMKTGMFVPTRLVCLAGLTKQHAGIVADDNGGLTIGAMTTLSAVEHDRSVMSHAPVLARAMRRLANVRVRNVATVGGALAHGDPHMDLPPVLAALDAVAVVRGPSGAREIPVADLYAGYYETVLEPGELIAAVVVPPSAGVLTHYRKTTSRTVDDWPTLGVAVSLLAAGSKIETARVVVSAATERMQRLPETEALLLGRAPDPALLEAAGRVAAGEVDVVEDAHGSAIYKSHLVEVEVRRALQDVLSMGSWA